MYLPPSKQQPKNTICKESNTYLKYRFTVWKSSVCISNTKEECERKHAKHKIMADKQNIISHYIFLAKWTNTFQVLFDQ
jgi:hypothetical protein